MSDSLDPVSLEEVLKITNNKLKLAKEMIAMFGAELPSLRQAINQAHQQQDYSELQNLVHKLHGACCYGGVPNLRTLSAEFETALKKQQHHTFSSQVTALNTEIDNILKFMQEQKIIS